MALRLSMDVNGCQWMSMALSGTDLLEVPTIYKAYVRVV